MMLLNSRPTSIKATSTSRVRQRSRRLSSSSLPDLFGSGGMLNWEPQEMQQHQEVEETLFDGRSGRRLASTSSGIATSYRVRVRNASLSYEGLSTELQESVDSGEFNQLLTANAEKNNATGLINATSSSVTTVNLIPDSSGGGSSSSDALSAGEIAGIVIGVVFGTILIARWVNAGRKNSRIIWE
mmetsp:Transcript_12131/g.20089  ORF Transcript_12131/g.20089 Transcript_12131/m.20089 type:complete len:185 (+) Transcript_12131:500-1054(+)